MGKVAVTLFGPVLVVSVVLSIPFTPSLSGMSCAFESEENDWSKETVIRKVRSNCLISIRR